MVGVDRPCGSEARFNESFANFVGHRGAIQFFCEAVADERRCRQARDRWHDTRVFGRFFNRLVDSLDHIHFFLRPCIPTDIPEADYDVTLTVTPSANAVLGTGEPIADVARDWLETNVFR